MDFFELQQLLEQHRDNGSLYLEFLRVPSMSMGLYKLAAGQNDLQKPHTEDEVYYIVSGTGKIHVGGEERDVQAGSIVYVAAMVLHYFHAITEDLTIIVFFAPAEYANKA